MKTIHTEGIYEYTTAELTGIFKNIKPVSKKNALGLGGLYYFSNETFDYELSSLADRSKIGSIKQKGLYPVAKLGMSIDCSYRYFFRPSAVGVLKRIPPQYLEEQSGVVAYSVKMAPFPGLLTNCQWPAVVTLYGLREGNKIPDNIQNSPIRLGTELY